MVIKHNKDLEQLDQLDKAVEYKTNTGVMFYRKRGMWCLVFNKKTPNGWTTTSKSSTESYIDSYKYGWFLDYTWDHLDTGIITIETPLQELIW